MPLMDDLRQYYSGGKKTQDFGGGRVGYGGPPQGTGGARPAPPYDPPQSPGPPSAPGFYKPGQGAMFGGSPSAPSVNPPGVMGGPEGRPAAGAVAGGWSTGLPTLTSLSTFRAQGTDMPTPSPTAGASLPSTATVTPGQTLQAPPVSAPGPHDDGGGGDYRPAMEEMEDETIYPRGTREYRQAVARNQMRQDRNRAAGYTLGDQGIRNVHEGGRAAYSRQAAEDFYGPAWDANFTYDLENGQYRNHATSWIGPDGQPGQWEPIPAHILAEIQQHQQFANSPEGKAMAAAWGGSITQARLVQQRIAQMVAGGHWTRLPGGGYDAGPGRGTFDQFGKPTGGAGGQTQAAGAGAVAGAPGSVPGAPVEPTKAGEQAQGGAPASRIRVDYIPSPQELQSLPPGTTMQTPLGLVSIGPDGRQTLKFDAQGRAAWQRAKGKLMQKYGQRLFDADPSAPLPEVVPGQWNFNPLSGQWIR